MHTVIDIMQIVTGIEVNSEVYFPKLREYCPSAEGTRAIKYNFVLFTSYGLDENTTCTETARTSEIHR